MTTQASRREFLRTASRLSVAGVATPWAVNLAAIGAAAAQMAPTDYKALVCVFMYGGNDHSNMVCHSTMSATRCMRSRVPT